MIRTEVLGDGPLAGIIAAAVGGQPDMLVVNDDAHVSVVISHGVVRAGAAPAFVVIGPDEPASMVAAVESGARGYVAADQPVTEMITAIRTVAGGGAVVPDAMLGALLSHVVRRRRIRADLRARLDGLTAREMEVFEAAARGLDKEALGELLFISPETARTHLERVRKKLGVSSRAGLVAFAAECGFDITPSESI